MTRTARGALAHSILASVLATCRQQGVALLDVLGEIRVGQAMTRTPQTLKANDSLAKAIELTLSTSQAAFPVLEWGTNKVVGMLGEADLLKG